MADENDTQGTPDSRRPVLRIHIFADLTAEVKDQGGQPVEDWTNAPLPDGVSVSGHLPAMVWGDGNSICVWHNGRQY